mmetsp:Transcript_95410/g.199621  ORF Transcript_95410/g.199621 Transcript_95410/m.199621 type:complete len:208 (-) Transcript_95410:168-791(-)
MMAGRPPLWRTKSRKFGQSPAMLPRAQTACSRTSSLGEPKSSTKRGRAPCSTTTRVCSAVPEAMFVSTQAASNWRFGRLTSFRRRTKRGTMPAWMTSAMGGFCSKESSFLNCCVALTTASGSFELRAATIRGISSMTQALACVCSTCGLKTSLGAEKGVATLAPGGASLMRRFLRRASSFVCLRSWMAASSRLRRASSASVAFLKPF